MTNIHYNREVKKLLKEWLFCGKILILYGARQVGKTTLTKEILLEYPGSVYMNCETNQVFEVLSTRNLERIKSYIGNARLVVFDEAQKIPEIGLTLKIIHDSWPDLQIIATGSSSFDLLNELSEPLTGRNVKFLLYPISFKEVSQIHQPIILEDRIELFMRFGMYPDIIDRPESQKIKLLEELSNDYLFRDIMKVDSLRHPDVLRNLLKALALQTGNEVSFNELSRLLKVTVETIQRYIEILERAFIIFKVGSFSRNLRKELSRSQKYYFFDLGIRNSLLQNFNSLENRNDVGALWENFCILERIKSNQANNIHANLYFWRTYDQKEIDLIEESGGTLEAWEFKYNPNQKSKTPNEFLKTYPGSNYNIIHKQNIFPFLTNTNISK